MSKTGEKTAQSSPQSLPLSPLWSVRQEAFQTALSALVERDVSTLSAYYEREKERAEPKPYEIVNGVAVLFLSGLLTRDQGWWSRIFGGTGILEQRLALMQAADDEEVSSILLYAYSPGGEVYGIADFSGSVVEARKKKKVWAYAADECCSACYWAICRAEKIICNPTALIGSIGIMQVIEDWSAAYKKQGVKVQVFKSSELKGAAVPGTSLTEEQAAEYQRIVDAIADQFFADVEEGRGKKLSETQMDTVATGAIFVGAEAIEMGLVDETGTLESTLSRLQPKDTTQNPVRRYGAQATTPPALSGNEEKKPMWRDFIGKLAAVFARKGRNHLAAAALGAKEDDAEDLVNRLEAQIQEEVKSALSTDPMLSALAGAEVKTPEALHQILQEASHGREYSAEVNKNLSAAAVRRFKQGEGSEKAIEAYQYLPLKARLAAIEQWEKEADGLVGTNPQTPARRQTVPKPVRNEAVDADESTLSAERQAEREKRRATAAQVAKNGGTR